MEFSETILLRMRSVDVVKEVLCLLQVGSGRHSAYSQLFLTVCLHLSQELQMDEVEIIEQFLER